MRLPFYPWACSVSCYPPPFPSDHPQILDLEHAAAVVSLCGNTSRWWLLGAVTPAAVRGSGSGSGEPVWKCEQVVAVAPASLCGNASRQQFLDALKQTAVHGGSGKQAAVAPRQQILILSCGLQTLHNHGSGLEDCRVNQLKSMVDSCLSWVHMMRLSSCPSSVPMVCQGSAKAPYQFGLFLSDSPTENFCCQELFML